MPFWSKWSNIIIIVENKNLCYVSTYHRIILAQNPFTLIRNEVINCGVSSQLINQLYLVKFSFSKNGTKFGTIWRKLAQNFCGLLRKAELYLPKGHLISKHFFGVFTSSKQMNETKSTRSKVEFICSFFGRNVGLKKSFRICLTFNIDTICEIWRHLYLS